MINTSGTSVSVLPPTYVLHRYHYSTQGTSGVFLAAGQLFHSIELPKKHHTIKPRRIPAGTYDVSFCALSNNRRFNNCWRLHDVPGFAGILMHIGNVAGDPTSGYQTDSLGCILIGMTAGTLTIRGKQQKAVIRSADAFRLMAKNLPTHWKLEIRDEI